MSLEGLGDVQRNLAEAIARMHHQAAQAADESALLLEAASKQTTVFRDVTGLLRGSIRGGSAVTEDVVRIVLSANKTYALFVEQGHFAKRNTTRYSVRKGRATSMRVSDRAYGTAVQSRSYIWATVINQQGNVMKIFRNRLAL